MDTRPNIIMFMPDQLRADALGLYGNDIAVTPNLDAFAAAGTVFEQAFTQHSVCSPSRISMFSGTYPQTRGHRTLDHLLAADEFNVFWALKESGYHVAWLAPRGDTFAPGVAELSVDEYGFIDTPEHELSASLTAGPEEADTWDRIFYLGSRGEEKVVDFDEAAVRSAERWLAAPPMEPWVLFLPLMFPHCPFGVEEPWFSLHDRESFPEPVGPKTGPTPRFVDALRREYGTEDVTADMWREVAATYYGMVSRIDDQFGRVLEQLKTGQESGKIGETISLFLSDHGEYLGDYGLVEKWPAGLDEVLLRVPLIVGGDGVASDVRRDDLVEMVDLTPTLLDIAGLEPAPGAQFGRSLVPLLEDRTPLGYSHRSSVFSEGGFRSDEGLFLEDPPFPYDLKGKVQHDDPSSVGRAYAVRTREWTYIYRIYDTDELYDRINDPHELNNLVGNRDFSETEAHTRDVLLERIATSNDVIPRRDPRFPLVGDPLVTPAEQLDTRRSSSDRG